MIGPLTEVDICLSGAGSTLRLGEWFVRGLGGRVVSRGRGFGEVVGHTDLGIDTYLAGVALAAAGILAKLSSSVIEVHASLVSAQLDLQDQVRRAEGTPPIPLPKRCRASGDGAVHTDLLPGDEELFQGVVEALGSSASDPERLASAAQDVHLPVTPYRRLVPAGWPDFPISAVEYAGNAGGGIVTVPAEQPSLKGVRVVDMTATWAGPLCTWLLAACGAEVIKVEPTCRPDGLRFGRGADGRGRSPMFTALNRNKIRADLDLRCGDAREAFEGLIKGADVLVDSFSPRVLSNFGYQPDILRQMNPGLVHVALPAFPASTKERSWISYGPGVHAMSGLGWNGECYQPPAMSYPDPVAGFTAFAAAIAGLAGRRRRGWAGKLEVSLAAAIAPLARRTVAGFDPDVPRCTDDLADPGKFAASPAPFLGPGLPVADKPAPEFGEIAGARRL